MEVRQPARAGCRRAKIPEAGNLRFPREPSLLAHGRGWIPPPGEGARFDVHFEGPVAGARLSGSVKGVDYLHLRADGRFQLDIRGEITTGDGKKIALYADGVAMGEPPVLQLRENAKLTTSHPEYSWVNTLQIWAPGTVDLSTGEIRVRGYAV